MTTERLIIEVSEKGTLVVKRNLEDVAKTAKKTGGALGVMTKAFAAIGGAILVQQIVAMADEYTNVQNRLKMVTNGEAELAAVTQELFNISNRTRGSFSAAAEMYARVALSAKNLAVSQRELLDFTETLNMVLATSGVTSQEAAGGMIQLSQGLASGALRGDEFRAVAETMPAVLDILAKAMGKRRDEMRQLGTEGKITTQIFLKAFKEARVEVAERFAKTLPTAGQALVVLKNQMMGLVGGTMMAGGASSMLGKAILTISDALPKLKDTLLGVVDVGVGLAAGIAGLFKDWGKNISEAAGKDAPEKFLGAWKMAWWTFIRTLAQIIDLAINILDAFSTSLVAWAVSGAKGWQAAFSLDWDKAVEEWTKGGEQIGQAFNEAFTQKSPVTDMVDTWQTDVLALAAKRAAEASMPGAKVNLEARDAASAAKAQALEDQKAAQLLAESNVGKYMQSLRDEATLLGTISSERKIQQELLKAKASLGIDATPAVMKEAEAIVRSNAAKDELVTLYDQLTGPQQDFVKQMELLEKLKPQLPIELYNQELQRLKTGLADTRPEFIKQVELLREQQALMMMDPREAEIKSQVNAASKTMPAGDLPRFEDELRFNRALGEQQQLINDLNAPLREYSTQLQALENAKPSISARAYAIELASIKENLAAVSAPQAAFNLLKEAEDIKLKEKIITQGQYNQKLKELKDILNDQLGKVDQLGEFSKALWDNASSALNSFIDTGKIKFSDFASSMLADLQKIIAKMLMMQAFKALGLPGFATGGSFLVGGAGGTDSQVVAFKATPGERVDVRTPGQQAAGKPQPAAPSPSPVIKVINVLNPDDIKDAMSSAQGEQVIMNVISRNRGAVRQAIS